MDVRWFGAVIAGRLERLGSEAGVHTFLMEEVQTQHDWARVARVLWRLRQLPPTAFADILRLCHGSDPDTIAHALQLLHRGTPPDVQIRDRVRHVVTMSSPEIPAGPAGETERMVCARFDEATFRAYFMGHGGGGCQLR